MSLIVFIIAAAPAALVWYIGYKSQSKFKIYLTAVLCACAGLLTGNPIYAALDVIFVIVGLVFGLQAQKDQQRRRADAAMRSQFAQTGWRGLKPSTRASDDTEQGWDERCKAMDEKIAAHRAKLLARQAEAATAGGGHKPSTGASDDTEQAWDKRCAEFDAKRAERLVALRARKAEAAAAALAPKVEAVATKHMQATVPEAQAKKKQESQTELDFSNDPADDPWSADSIEGTCEGWYAQNVHSKNRNSSPKEES